MIDAVCRPDRGRPGQGLLGRQLRRGQLVRPQPALEARAIQRGRFEDWILNQASPHPRRLRRPDRRHGHRGQLGAFHAANFAFRGPTCSLGHLPERRLRRPPDELGERGDAVYFNSPMDYVANLRRPPRVAAGPAVAAASLRPGPVGGHHRGGWSRPGPFDRLLGEKGMPPRDRPVGPRRAPRLAVLAGPARPPPAAVRSEEGAPWPRTHLIGLLLGTEDDWPTAFEQYLGRPGPGGRSSTARRHEGGPPSGSPSSLRPAPARPPRPGHRPPGLLVRPPPGVAQEDRPDGPGHTCSTTHSPSRRWRSTPATARPSGWGSTCPRPGCCPTRSRPRTSASPRLALQPGLRLQAVGERVGYPMYMKPFHGGGWVNVYRIADPAELQAAYDASGRELMHVQAGGRGLRHLHPRPGHRPPDDGHPLRPDQAAALCATRSTTGS